MNKLKQQNNSDNTEEGMYFPPFEQPHVACYAKRQSMTHYRFFIDQPIYEAYEYRNLIQTLLTADESDVIELVFSSGGGDAKIATNIITALNSTEAHTIATIFGSCDSAASMIALNCNQCLVGPYGTMLVHSARYGFGGKQSDMKGYVEFQNKILEKLLKEVYSGFCTEEEIQRVIDGYEMYLDSEEIQRRLAQRDEIREEEIESLTEQKQIDMMLEDED